MRRETLSTPQWQVRHRSLCGVAESARCGRARVVRAGASTFPLKRDAHYPDATRMELDPGYFAVRGGAEPPRNQQSHQAAGAASAGILGRLDMKLDRATSWRRLGAFRWGLLISLAVAAMAAITAYNSVLAYVADSRGRYAATAGLQILMLGFGITFASAWVSKRTSGAAGRLQARLGPAAPSLAELTPGMHTCMFLGGAGLPLASGITYRFGVRTDHIAVANMAGVVVLHLPFRQILDMRAQGAGAVRSGGGFVGGGFGLEGAAEGMLIASALNALTTKTHVDSCLRLITEDAEGVFAFTRTLPSQLDLELSSFRVHQRQREALQVPAQPGVAEQKEDPLTRLERLVRLRDAGALTAAEFDQEKSALLNG